MVITTNTSIKMITNLMLNFISNLNLIIITTLLIQDEWKTKLVFLLSPTITIRHFFLNTHKIIKKDETNSSYTNFISFKFDNI